MSQDENLLQIKVDGKYICKFPNFITHTSVLEPCNILVSCPLLKYKDSGQHVKDYWKIKNFSEIECVCDAGQVSATSSEGYPICRKARLVDLPAETACIGFPHNPIDKSCLCPKNFISTADEAALNQAGYKSSVAYALTRLPPTCVMTPCKFDPTNGKMLVGSYWDGKTCVCPKNKSLMGVFIDESGNGNAVNVANRQSGYNACIQINTPANPDEVLVYVSQFVPPKGETKIWFEPWDFRDDIFPLVKTQLEAAKDTNVYIKSTFDSNNPDLIWVGTYENMETLDNYHESGEPTVKQSDLMLKMDPTKYEQLPIQFPFKEGNLIRNPISLKSTNREQLINFIHPLMVVDDKSTLGIYNKYILYDENDLVNVPQEKK